MESAQVAALAFPVPDGIIHEVQLGDSPEVGDGEDGIKHRLQADIFPLRGKEVHLQKTLVGALLDFNEIRNLNDCGNLGKVNPMTPRAVSAVRHSFDSLLENSNV
jgi:hypothetical protein